MHNRSIPETEPHHTHTHAAQSQDWRQRAAYGWRLQARRARVQAAYNSEWLAHADWCEQKARELEARDA